MQEASNAEPLKLYLDDDVEPFKVAPPPLTFQLSTIALPDGPHKLRIEAPNGLAPATIKEIPFTVRNGVAITVSGLEQSQTIAGQVQMVINAYAGNTEVDFEPRRAETPQPIPTWAWVVLLAVGAWTLFYLLNPQVASPLARAATSTVDDQHTGERIFLDACARCHGEDGMGQRPKIPPLVDADIALSETPAPLLRKVVASSRDSGTGDGLWMPEWGTRLTNEEIVSAVNYVRRSWGHDSTTIQLSHARPPAGIKALHQQFSRALKTRDAAVLVGCCTPAIGAETHLIRTDGIDARGAPEVSVAWQNYLQELANAGAKVRQVSFPDDRYDYDPASIDQDGSIVIGAGRIFIETEDANRIRDRAKGRFIHIYERQGGRWALVFDFADIPMAVGCLPGAPERICVPSEDGTTPALVPTVPATAPEGAIGYAEVQALLDELEKDARSAPHENFWEFDYDTFVNLRFPTEWGEDDEIRAVVPYDPAASNLIRALRGQPILVRLADGRTIARDDIERMPKGAPAMPEARIQQIEAWIRDGCPEMAGEPSRQPRPSGAPAPPPGPGPQEAPVDPFAPVPGFPPPGGNEAPAAPPGFPPPGGDPSPPAAPPGFPPPGGEPSAPSPPPGFPPPGGEDDAPAPPPGFPPPGGTPAPPPGFPPVQDVPPKDAERKVITYIEVQRLLGLVPTNAPGRLDRLAHDAFLKHRLPSPGSGKGSIHLVRPGDGEGSNLVRLLRDGRDVVVSGDGGMEATTNLMPLRGASGPLPEADVRRIVAWIDAGCPE